MDKSDFPNYYSFLGVPFYATQEEIRAAYKDQIRFFHPDAGNVAPEIALMVTQNLNIAYGILSDVHKKRIYDEQLMPILILELSVASHEETKKEKKREKANTEAQPEEPIQEEQPNERREARQEKSTVNQANVKKKVVKTPNPERIRTIKWFLLFSVCVAVLFGAALWWDYSEHGFLVSEGVSVPSINTPTVTPSPTLKPKNRPLNGEYFVSTYTDLYGPLTVKTKGEKDYYIKIVDISTDTEAVAFYVRGGMSVDVEVPLGTYEFRYACGTTWYGTLYHFGDDTVYAKADDLFVFREDGDYITGWTVELYPQVDGNLDEIPISKADF